MKSKVIVQKVKVDPGVVLMRIVSLKDIYGVFRRSKMDNGSRFW